MKRRIGAGQLFALDLALLVLYTILGSTQWFNWEDSVFRAAWLLLGLAVWVVGPVVCLALGIGELGDWWTRRPPVPNAIPAQETDGPDQRSRRPPLSAIASTLGALGIVGLVLAFIYAMQEPH